MLLCCNASLNKQIFHFCVFSALLTATLLCYPSNPVRPVSTVYVGLNLLQTFRSRSAPRQEWRFSSDVKGRSRLALLANVQLQLEETTVSGGPSCLPRLALIQLLLTLTGLKRRSVVLLSVHLSVWPPYSAALLNLHLNENTFTCELNELIIPLLPLSGRKTHPE